MLNTLLSVWLTRWRGFLAASWRSLASTGVSPLRRYGRLRVKELGARIVPTTIVPLFFVGQDSTDPTAWVLPDDWSFSSGGPAQIRYFPGNTDANGNWYAAVFDARSPTNCYLSGAGNSEDIPYLSITGWHQLTIQSGATLTLDDTNTGSTIGGNATGSSNGTINIIGGATLKIGGGSTPHDAVWSAGSIITNDQTGIVELVHGILDVTVTNLNDSTMPKLKVDSASTFLLEPTGTGDKFCPVSFTNNGNVILDAATTIYVLTETQGAAGNEWPNLLENTGGLIEINPGTSGATYFYCTIDSENGDEYGNAVSVDSGTVGLYGTGTVQPLAPVGADFWHCKMAVAAGTLTFMNEYGIAYMNNSQLIEENTTDSRVAKMQGGAQAVVLLFNNSSINMGGAIAGGQYGGIDCTHGPANVTVSFTNGSTYNCQYSRNSNASNEFVCYQWFNDTTCTLNMVNANGTPSGAETYGNVIITGPGPNSFPTQFNTLDVNGAPYDPKHWSFNQDKTFGETVKFTP